MAFLRVTFLATKILTYNGNVTKISSKDDDFHYKRHCPQNLYQIQSSVHIRRVSKEVLISYTFVTPQSALRQKFSTCFLFCRNAINKNLQSVIRHISLYVSAILSMDLFLVRSCLERKEHQECTNRNIYRIN